jgi:uncharacterized membrane protein
VNWAQFVVQWLHVILGMLWLGGALYTNFILIPALGRLPLATQREVGTRSARSPPASSPLRPSVW